MTRGVVSSKEKGGQALKKHTITITSSKEWKNNNVE
jgi:hypothetical protein